MEMETTLVYLDVYRLQVCECVPVFLYVSTV